MANLTGADVDKLTNITVSATNINTVVTAGPCDVDANLSSEAQAAILLTPIYYGEMGNIYGESATEAIATADQWQAMYHANITGTDPHLNNGFSGLIFAFFISLIISTIFQKKKNIFLGLGLNITISLLFFLLSNNILVFNL